MYEERCSQLNILDAIFKSKWLFIFHQQLTCKFSLFSYGSHKMSSFILHDYNHVFCLSTSPNLIFNDATKPLQLSKIGKNKLCLVSFGRKGMKHVMQDYHDITHICRRCSTCPFCCHDILIIQGRGGVASSHEAQLQKMFHQG